MTVMALALAHAREHNCDALEGLCVYDSSDEVVGWIGQVMDDTGHPCEHMGMGDDGYTSCWSSSEISRLRDENAKLRELAERLRIYVEYSCDKCWVSGDARTCGMHGCVTHRTCEMLQEMGIGVD